jgi:hypothetical protein
MPEAEEYIIASVKIPISIKNGNSTTFQDRCQIEFYRCSNLDEFPVNNSLESSTLMQKFSQIFAGGRRPVIPVADSSEDELEEQTLQDEPEEQTLQEEPEEHGEQTLHGEHKVLQASGNGISKTEDTSPIKISKPDPEYKTSQFSRTAIFDDLELVKKSSRYNTFRSYSTRAKSHNKFTQRLNHK